MNTTTGKHYWRSLDEIQDTPEFRQFVEREFPTAASEIPEGVSRRRWLQLMGASFALGGLAGCRWEAESIAPFAIRPENRVPGEAEYFATSIDVAGMPRHLLVTCYDGRPIKVEGNADHPNCRGSADVFAQASILELYDPDRSDVLVEKDGRQVFRREWEDFARSINPLLNELQEKSGEGLALLIEPQSSCTFSQLLSQCRDRFPQARVYSYSPIADENSRRGTALATDQSLRTLYRLDQARIIACFDSDLLGQHPASPQMAGDFATHRDPTADMNRLYAIESQFSVTGASADHRLPLKSHDIGVFLVRVDQWVRSLLQDGETGNLPSKSGGDQFAFELAKDLVANPGASVVSVGPSQPAEVHALAHDLNRVLGNFGRTVDFVDDPALQPDVGTIVELVQSVRAGRVGTLFILGGNPVYDAPSDLQFARVIQEVSKSIHLSLYRDETSRACTWHLPQAHAFEAWNDVRGWDGSISIAQPLISPLLGGRSLIEVLAMICQDRRDPQELVRDAVCSESGRSISRQDWMKILHDGFLANSALTLREVESRFDVQRDAAIRSLTDTDSPDLELVYTKSDSVLDGRFANNGWLQETPELLTKLTWDNAAVMNPTTAEELGVGHGSIIRVRNAQGELELPVFLLPGQAKGSIGVSLGYGRTAAGHVGGSSQEGVLPVGVNVYPLRHSAEMDFTAAVQVSATGEKYEFATTQDHHAIDAAGMEETGRRVGELVREATLDEFRKDPSAANHSSHHNPLESLWTEKSYDDHAWGMAIDLNKCIGCNACLVACQAENNVPIVGKDQVAKGREMHWLRVDRYFTGEVDRPAIATQPVACHHCENAPCEQVCPVAATVHSDEGLNDMVYNRCVGTRYCANNCPYKVRRFNFFDYNEKLEEPNRQLAQLVVNPEVTVRSRGVMEKCTYCVQRIQKVKIGSKNDRRPIRDGEIMTACQQACPTQAIEFGDLNDTNSRVAKAHHDPRAYGMLEELNVKPRTKYLARIRNLNPALAAFENSSIPDHGSHHGPS